MISRLEGSRIVRIMTRQEVISVVAHHRRSIATPIPFFPAIRPYLEAAFDEALGGAEHVMPEEYRRRAQGPGGWRNANLRTTLAKVVRRAGLKPWPRFWHSMRASCETDLAREFPLAIVAKWRGNTQAVAMRHYVDVTNTDFERAT